MVINTNLVLCPIKIIIVGKLFNGQDETAIKKFKHHDLFLSMLQCIKSFIKGKITKNFFILVNKDNFEICKYSRSNE